MARLFSRIQKVWQKALGACSFQSLRRAWDRWGFYVSLALALTLIGYGAVAIRNRPAREVAPVAAMQPALASPAPTATAAPMPLFQWPLSGEILMAHSPESAVYQPALGAFTAHEGVDIASRAGETVCAGGRWHGRGVLRFFPVWLCAGNCARGRLGYALWRPFRHSPGAKRRTRARGAGRCYGGRCSLRRKPSWAALAFRDAGKWP